MKLFVGSLPYECTDEELKTIFERVGEVVSAKVILDHATGRSRGFGFVEMADDEAGRRSVDELNESRIGSRSIVVKKAHDRAPAHR